MQKWQPPIPATAAKRCATKNTRKHGCSFDTKDSSLSVKKKSRMGKAISRKHQDCPNLNRLLME
jgi:hypothetical protein